MQVNGVMEANQGKYNEEVKRFGEKLKNLMAYNLVRLSQKGKGELIASLRTKYKKNSGDIESLSVGFLRQGVFFAKGVGRGYKVVSGKVMKVPNGGAVMRQPKDWHNDTIEKQVPELIRIVAEYRANAAVDATEIKIK